MRYFLGFLIVLGLIILAIILLLRLIFGGGGEDTQTPKANLIDYARTSKVMRLTIDGPINYHGEHQRVRIDVGTDENQVVLIQGYQSDVIERRSFSNNPEAYANFLRALDLAGYTLGDDDESLADERGFCPEGNRYVFEIVDGSETEQRYWDTSCGGTRTFNGETGLIRSLFTEQIPNYDEIISTENYSLN